MTQLILASSSPRRRELIHTLGLSVESASSDVDEHTEPGLTPEQIVETLSLRKAGAIASEKADMKLPHGSAPIVVGSDTIVVLDRRVLGKPRDKQEAAEMLAALQGRTHRVYSGLACIRPGTVGQGVPSPEDERWGRPVRFGDIGHYRLLAGETAEFSVAAVGYTVSRVTFRPLSDTEIEAYVRTGEPLDKAGAYGVQGRGALFVERLDGDFYSVMGLPLNMLYAVLQKCGVRPF